MPGIGVNGPALGDSRIVDEYKAAAANVPAPPSGDLTTPVLFAQNFDKGTTGYMFIKNPPPAGVPYTNIRGEPSLVTIEDLRGKEDSVNLDHDSIQVLRGLVDMPRSPEVIWDSEKSIETQFYPAVESAVKKAIPGAHTVHIFRHGIRHSKSWPVPYNPPAMIAHLDQTGPAAVNRVLRHMGPVEGPRLLQGRYRIVHFWTPLNGPVYTFPVAFASSATVKDDDIQTFVSHLGGVGGLDMPLGRPVSDPNPAEQYREDFGAPRYADGQRWFYLSGISQDEALLAQIFDSKALVKNSGVRGGRAVHSAFRDPRTPAGAPDRWSIEVSCLVFSDE
ncbi:hypothetical protein E4T38_09663 [Aureobasidium subglaciale]|nr:hypothetical protein E4T38_09663 [Aureobasidium subglaciale]KAI5213616.1 hypothetical protein E4T40_09605 [Aureobasidium subglaciale]KAI5215279.1 hypothetical protein E4T41_09643 [Aureobasidium subglaciale]KAI5253265.1 hypothetical protein E4T46_09620 [Aureobasidium subglaciale]